MAEPTDNLRAALWMVLSAAIFAVVNTVIKYVADFVPPPEIVFFRCLFGLSVISPFVIRHGWRIYRTQRPGLHVIRTICGTIGMNLGFYATAHLPLATAGSLAYTRPLWMIVIGMAFLGERVRWRRGLATLAGFAGVLVIMGPAEVGDLYAAAAALGSAAFITSAMAVVRHQSATDGSMTILVWFATGTLIGSIIPAAVVWETPSSPTIWLLLVFIGVASTIGQFFLIRALALGEATVVNPIDYSQILILGVLGYIQFGEIPTAHTWIGAAIIVGSTLYIVLRGARLRQTPT